MFTFLDLDQSRYGLYLEEWLSRENNLTQFFAICTNIQGNIIWQIGERFLKVWRKDEFYSVQNKIETLIS